jgi:hypothetical protein
MLERTPLPLDGSLRVKMLWSDSMRPKRSLDSQPWTSEK